MREPGCSSEKNSRLKGLDLSDINVSENRYDSNYYLSNFHEQGTEEPIVRGRMKANVNFWKEIGAPDDVISVIEEGYKIPLLTTPPPVILKNNKSALDNSSFVTDAVNDLLSKGLIVESTVIPDIVNPLSVSIQSSGKKRLILDLRYVNYHVWKEKIKFEDWSVATQYFRKDTFMFSFDLKSGYHHIDIYADHRRFLSFSWDFGDGNGNRFFSFQVLPFGLSSAPFVFTKCLRPLVKYWRDKGFFIVLYLDDGWGIANSYNECYSIASLVKQDLLNAGLVPNIEKSVWNPVQSIDWLGMRWDTVVGSLKVIDRRVNNILTDVESLLRKLPYVTARQLATFVGRVISMMPVVGRLVQLKTRYLSMTISLQCHWDREFRIANDSPIIEEIFFWKNNVVRLNNKMLFEYTLPQVLLFSDASHTGCGAIARVESESRDEMRYNHVWSTEESGKSSTWRELKGVALAIESFGPRLKGKCVKVFTERCGGYTEQR